MHTHTLVVVCMVRTLVGAGGMENIHELGVRLEVRSHVHDMCVPVLVVLRSRTSSVARDVQQTSRGGFTACALRG